MGCLHGRSDVFGLKMAPTTFQRIITKIFDEYILMFMKVFLDDFAIYGPQMEHLSQLRLCLDRCRQARLSLNPTKCAFFVASGNLLGHIVSHEGIDMDPDKVQAIMNDPVVVLFCTHRRNQGRTAGALNQGITGQEDEQCETAS